MSLFKDTKKKPEPWKTVPYFTYTVKPTPVEPERAFSTMGHFVIKLRKRVNDDITFWFSFVNIIKIRKKLLNLVITISLINYALTNNSNYKMVFGFYLANHIYFKTRKNLGFPGFSSLPETRMINFCPELETLFSTRSVSAAPFKRTVPTSENTKDYSSDREPWLVLLRSTENNGVSSCIPGYHQMEKKLLRKAPKLPCTNARAFSQFSTIVSDGEMLFNQNAQAYPLTITAAFKTCPQRR